MSDTVKHSKVFLYDLDAEAARLPGRSVESIAGIFVHLETIALRSERELDSSGSSEVEIRARSILAKSQLFDTGITEQISLRELGRHIIRSAQAQVRVLELKVEQIQTLVIINSWEVARQLWSDLLPTCKTPLFALSLLEELWGIAPDLLESEGWTLSRHWQQFVLIQAEIEVLLARQHNMVELSNALEGHLLTWLRKFSELLKKLDDESAS